jgi:hypothetical protein
MFQYPVSVVTFSSNKNVSPHRKFSVPRAGSGSSPGCFKSCCFKSLLLQVLAAGDVSTATREQLFGRIGAPFHPVFATPDVGMSDAGLQQVGGKTRTSGIIP